MCKSLYLGGVILGLGMFPISESLACTWDLNGVGYPASCGYRGGGGGGGGGYVAPAPYIPPPPSPAEIAARQARPINDNGIRAEKAGNYDLAVTLFEQAVRLSPNDAVLVNNLRHARAQVIDQQGLQAANAGNSALALSLFEQAWRMLPSDHSYDVGRATLKKNIQQARARLQEQEGREKQLQQDKVAAGNMQQTIQGLAQSLSTAPPSAGLDFNGAKPGNNATASSGLPFMASNPATTGNPAQVSNSTPPDNAVQLNPGAKSDEAQTFHRVDNTAAIKSDSAKGQLFNSLKESIGQLFDNGRSHDGDGVPVDPKMGDVATPSAQAVDPRFAKSADYQTAAKDLTSAQATAETLNRKMTTLQDQQKSSPTPQRQIEIFNLSAQVTQANGAVTIATNNLDTVKKKITKDGPAIVVDDGATAAVQAAPVAVSK